jgi:hypothetical protein
MRDIGELAKGETPDADDYDIVSETLNLLIKSWQNQGIGIWLNQECTLYLQNDTVQYALGPSGDHWTADPHKTELAAAGTTGDLTITVDSYAGMADGDYIGIELDSGTIQWTTIDTPAAVLITIDDALTGAAAVDNHVYFYTDLAQRPIEILKDTIRRVDENAHETPIKLISRSEYMAINDKISEGPVNSVYYDRQLTNGQLYVWPEPSSTKQFLRMTIRRPISDVDALVDHIEVPPEFLLALEYNLAIHIAPKFDAEVSKILAILAVESLQDAKGLSREGASVFIR